MAAAILGSAALVVLLAASPLTLRNGDSVQYAHLIAAHDFSQMTIHVGYYLLGAFSFGLLPLSIDASLSIINCFFGAMTVALVCLMGRLLGGRLAVGVLASAILLTNAMFVLESIYAEVYVSHLFFVLLALVGWLLGRPILTGVAYAAAHLISPSAVFLLPALVILRPNVGMLLRAGLTASILVVPVVAWHLGDYVGGLLYAAGHSWMIEEAISKEAHELFTGFLACLMFLTAGIAAAVKLRKLRPVVVALLATWLAAFLLGEKTYDVPVQLPVYAWMAVIAAIGADRLMSRHHAMLRTGIVACMGVALILSLGLPALSPFGARAKVVAALAAVITGGCALFVRGPVLGPTARRIPVAAGLVVPIALNALVAVAAVRTENEHAVGLRQTVAYMDEVAPPGYLVIAAYDQGMLYEHYVYNLLFTGRWLHPEWLLAEKGWGLRYQVQARERWRETIGARGEVWFLGLEYPELTERLENELRASGYTIEEIVPAVRRARFHGGK